jgi:hypothetical protein
LGFSIAGLDISLSSCEIVLLELFVVAKYTGFLVSRQYTKEKVSVI